MLTAGTSLASLSVPPSSRRHCTWALLHCTDTIGQAVLGRLARASLSPCSSSETFSAFVLSAYDAAADAVGVAAQFAMWLEEIACAKGCVDLIISFNSRAPNTDAPKNSYN